MWEGMLDQAIMGFVVAVPIAMVAPLVSWWRTGRSRANRDLVDESRGLAHTVSTVPGPSCDRLAWFRRHLHWTVVLSLPLAVGVALLVNFIVVFASSSSAHPWLFLRAQIIVEGVCAMVWRWVLDSKGRSLWWLLLAVPVPLGFICLFSLENRSSLPPKA